MYTFEKILTFTTFIFGLFGNIICFLIYSRKKFEKISVSFYYKVVSINNIIVVLQTLGYFTGYIINNDYIYIRHLSNIYCKLITYIEWVTLPISTWIMVIVLFDRFMTIKFNKRFKFLENFKFKCIILISIYLASFCLYTPIAIDYKQFSYYFETNHTIDYKRYLYYFETNQTGFVLYCHHKDYTQLVSITDFIIFTTMPCTLMVIFTSLSILVIFKSRKRFKSQKLGENRLKKDIYFALSSIILSFLYFATNLPTTLFNLLSKEVSFSVIILQHANCAISIFIHLFTNKIFYHEFLRIICVNGKISPKSSITRTNTLKD